MPEKVYVNVPTGIPGVELRFEKGQEVDVPRAVARVFYLACLDYARAKKRAEIAAGKLKAMRPEVLKHANAIPGLAGVRSEPNDFSLLVVAQQQTEWDPELLRASLGRTLYPLLVEEGLAITLTLPARRVRMARIVPAITAALVKLGFNEEDLELLMGVEPTLRIDTERLEELVNSGTIELLPGTCVEKEPTYRVEVDAVFTAQKARKVKPAKKAAAKKSPVKKK